MKHGKKPTKKQSILIKQWKLDPAVWLVVMDKPDEMVLVHRYSDKTTRKIPEGGEQH